MNRPREAARLVAAADFDGDRIDVDPLLRAGSWVGTRTPVGLLVDARQWVVDAYVDEHEISRLQVGTPARFRARGAWRAVAATVSDIDSTRSTRLEHPLLDARHGGPIATQAGERASLPVKSLYRIRLTLAEPLPEHREARGVALISGQSRVTLWEGIKHLAAVVVRESSRRVDKRSASTKKAGDHPVAAAPVFLGSEVRVASGKGGVDARRLSTLRLAPLISPFDSRAIA